MTFQQKSGISLLTRGTGLMETGKDYLRRLGFGSSLGPLAVEKNLAKGLNSIGAKFQFNPTVLTKNICLLRAVKSVQWIRGLKTSNYTIIAGPNLPAENLKNMYSAHEPIKYFLAPSEEVKFAYVDYGIPQEKIIIWPVGIDTEIYLDTRGNFKTHDCLLYFKSRQQHELQQVIELLKNSGQTYKFLAYGNYKEADLQQAVKDCRYAIILDATESQGIAIQSIMAANLPLFVFDQIYLGHPTKTFINENLRVTSVPYWDERCGMKVPTDTFGKSTNIYMQIPEAAGEFGNFLNRLSSFKPREYILQNLGLEKQASEFVNIFEKKV